MSVMAGEAAAGAAASTAADSAVARSSNKATSKKVASAVRRVHVSDSPARKQGRSALRKATQPRHGREFGSRSVRHYQRILMVTFFAAEFLLILSPMSPKVSKVDPQKWIRQQFAIMLTWIILAGTSAFGPKAARLAAGFSVLITLVLLMAKQDIIIAVAQALSGKTVTPSTSSNVQLIPNAPVSPPSVFAPALYHPAVAGSWNVIQDFFAV